MNLESLKRGNEIIKEIQNLYNYKRVIKEKIKRYDEIYKKNEDERPTTTQTSFSVEFKGPEQNFTIDDDLLPVPIISLLNMSLLNVNNKIKELEFEFNQL